MTAPAAIRATYADFKHVKTRGVLQIVCEVPIAAAQHALDVLGVPDPATERWVAIALLNTDTAAQAESPGLQTPVPPAEPPRASDAGAAPHAKKERRPFHALPLSQQCAIRCQEPAFLRWAIRFVPLTYEEDVSTIDEERIAACVRSRLSIKSRAELDTNPEAAAKWRVLETEFKLAHGLLPERRG